MAGIAGSLQNNFNECLVKPSLTIFVKIFVSHVSVKIWRNIVLIR
jgi:hypothetical protein